MGGVCCPKARACFSTCCSANEQCVLGQCVTPARAGATSTGSRSAIVCDVATAAPAAAGKNATATPTTTRIYCPRNTVCLNGACVSRSLTCGGQCCAAGSTCVSGGQAGAGGGGGAGSPQCCPVERIVAAAATGALRCCADGSVAGAAGTGRCFSAGASATRATAVRTAAASCPLAGHLRAATMVLGGDVPRPQLPRGSPANGAAAESVAECCARCAAAAPACAHFSYEVATRRCYLKAAGGGGGGVGAAASAADNGNAPLALESASHVSGTMAGAKPLQPCPSSRACPQLGLCCAPSKECRAVGAAGGAGAASTPSSSADEAGDLAVAAGAVSSPSGAGRNLLAQQQLGAQAGGQYQCVTACRAAVYEQGVSYSGGDIEPGGLPVGSVRECCQSCSEDPDCGAFTFDADRGLCFLKGGGAGEEDVGEDGVAVAAAPAPPGGRPTGARGAVRGGQFFSGRVEGVAPVPQCPASELCGASCGCDDGFVCQGGKTCVADGGAGAGAGGAGATGAGGGAAAGGTSSAAFPFLPMPGLPPAPPAGQPLYYMPAAPPAYVAPPPVQQVVAMPPPAMVAPSMVPAAPTVPGAATTCGTTGAACTAGQRCVAGACCPNIYACGDASCCRPPGVCSGNTCTDPNAALNGGGGAGGAGGAGGCPSGIVCSGSCCPAGSRCVSGTNVASTISGSVSAGVCCPLAFVCAAFGTAANAAATVTGLVATPDADATCCRQGTFCTNGICCASGISCGLLCCALGEVCTSQLVSGEATFPYNPSGFSGGLGGVCCPGGGRVCGDRCCADSNSVCVIDATTGAARCCPRDRSCPQSGGRGATCCSSGSQCSTSSGTPTCG